MEDNRINVQQQLFVKYLIEAIQKQQNKPIDFSTKIFQSSLNVNQQDSIISPVSTNSIPLKKRYKSNTVSSPPPIDLSQGDAYCERRRKNNEAAKRSRDTRRAKEDEIALRAAFLEQENVQLRLENTHLKQENIQLRCQIYSSIES